MKVVYIHGFQSSSKAKKAQILDEVISKNYPDISFEAPDFPDNIKLALSVLERKLNHGLKKMRVYVLSVLPWVAFYQFFYPLSIL